MKLYQDFVFIVPAEAAYGESADCLRFYRSRKGNDYGGFITKTKNLNLIFYTTGLCDKIAI